MSKRNSINNNKSYNNEPSEDFMYLMTASIKEIGYENLKVDGLRDHMIKEV